MNPSKRSVQTTAGWCPLYAVMLFALCGPTPGWGQELPRLHIDRFTTDFVELSWDDEGGEYALETCLDLSQTFLPYPSVPVVVNGTYEFLATTALGRQFFRLSGTVPSLYVVNVNDDFTSYANFQTATGNVPPTTSIALGAATSLFQPRDVVLTISGRLLISRLNGGIVGWNDAATANGSPPADLVVDGAATGLDSPIALEYDRDADRLFVGNAAAADGLLVFDNVSLPAFDGDVAPDRAFGPDDRIPFNAEPTGISMTIDAFTLDDGKLYVVDTSGLNQNSSRILVYNSPGSASGQTNPARTLTGPWAKVRGIAVGDNRLFLVDDTAVVFVVDGIDSASGTVSPTQVTIQGSGVSLRAVSVFNNAHYFLDENNAAILAFEAVLDGSATNVTPDRVIEGSSTGLRLPTNMAVGYAGLP